MVARYLLLCFFVAAPKTRACLCFRRGDEGDIRRSALEDARAEILERIKLASGYPMNRSPFPESLRVTAEHRPRKKLWHEQRDREGTSPRSDRKNAAKSRNPGGREKWEARRGMESAPEVTNEEFADGRRQGVEADFQDFRGGYRRGRAFLIKGYESEHRKDETKGSDSFWDSQQTKGKWFRCKRKEKGEERGGSEESGNEEKENAERAKEEAEGVEVKEDEPERVESFARSLALNISRA